MMSTSNPRRLYFLLESLRSAALGTVLPVFALYYRHFEISLFQIAVLAAIFEATILIFEVPSGIWADRYSRRMAMIVSEVCLAIGGLIFFGLPGLWFFIFGEIFQGVGEAFGSGSLEAWIVDELQIGDSRRATESLFANALRWKTLSMLAGAIFAGILGAHFLRWVWLPFVVLHTIGIIASIRMKDTTTFSQSSPPEKASVRRIVSSGIQRLKESIVLKVLVGFGLVCAFAEEGIDEFWQVHFDEMLHVPVSWFGVFVALPALLIFLFAPRVTEFMGRRLSSGWSISFFQLLLAGSIFGMALLGNFPAAVCLGGILVFQDLKKPIVSAWANEHILSEHRAGMLSFLNMVSSAGEVGASLVFGYLAGRLGLNVVFLLAGFSSILAIGFLFAGWDDHQRRGS